MDLSSRLGQRVQQRLLEERAIWLTTVSPAGTPQPNPVWFTWDGETVLVYSHREAFRNRNLRQNPKVALNFDSDHGQREVAIITGSARFAPDEPPVTECEPYLAKYAAAITAELGSDAAAYAATYSVAIRITPERLRGF